MAVGYRWARPGCVGCRMRPSYLRWLARDCWVYHDGIQRVFILAHRSIPGAGGILTAGLLGCSQAQDCED